MIQCCNAKIWHTRVHPTAHSFNYPYLLVRMKIDQNGIESSNSSFFSTKKRSIFSVSSKNYLTKSSKDIFTQLKQLAEEKEWAKEATQFIWITSPQFLGITFNPVSFYYALDANDKTLGMIVEVNNTFQERHIYILSANLSKQRHSKEFHVSPFNDMQGAYQFYFSPTKNTDFNIKIELERDNKIIFTAGMHGQWHQLTTKNILYDLIGSHLSPWLTLWRIHIQAIVLFAFKRLKYHVHTNATHPNTIIKQTETL